MAHKGLIEDQLQQFQALAANWGKIVARRVAEDTAAGADLDFRGMEQVAAAVAAGLTQGTLQALLEQQAQGLTGPQPCPDCSAPCEVKSQERHLQVQGAQLTFCEPFCHCTRCRRDFFPSTPCSGLGQP